MAYAARGRRRRQPEGTRPRPRRVRVAADRRLEQRAQHGRRRAPEPRAAGRPGLDAPRELWYRRRGACDGAPGAGGVPHHTAPRELVRDGRREQHRPRGAAVQRGRFLPALDAPEGHGRADGAGAGVARLVRSELLQQRERVVAADDPLAARSFYFPGRQRAGVDRRALCRELAAVPHDEQARLRRLLVLAELDEP